MAIPRLPASVDHKVYDVPLKLIQSNPGNPHNIRDAEIIGSLVRQGYSIFPRDGAEFILWYMLNGEPDADPDPKDRARAVTAISEMCPAIMEFEQSVASYDIIKPISLVVDADGNLGIESGLVRALVKSLQYALEAEPPGVIAAEISHARKIDDIQARALIENLHHMPTRNPMGFAYRLQIMRDVGRKSIRQLSELTGITEQSVRNYLDLTTMPPDVVEALAQDKMTITKAREMAKAAREGELDIEEVVDQQSPTRTPVEFPRTKRRKALKWEQIFLLWQGEEDEHTKEVLCQVLQISPQEAKDEAARRIMEDVEIDLSDLI